MQVTLIVLFAHWCPKCNMMMPIVDEIAREYGDVLRVTKVEVKDENGNTKMQKESYDPLSV